jgi:folate-binding protein YgfZ
MTLTRLAPSLDQYKALTEGVAVVERPGVGRLRLDGKDTLDLLDRLSTNDLTGLAPGSSVSTVLTTNKGRVIDLLTVYMLDDHLEALCSRDAVARVMEWIDFYTFDEDVTVADLTNTTAITGLAGPDAAELVGKLAGDAAADLPPYGVIEAQIGGVAVTIVPTNFLGAGTFDVVAPAGDGDALRAALGAVAQVVGPEALEAARIERGVPAFGSELNEDHNPLEAGLMDSISFNKGCYVGQEVVARLNTYDKVQRRLAVLRWPPDGDSGGVATGDEVAPKAAPGGDNAPGSGKPLGAITSVAEHPNGGYVGLAYVRRAFESTQVAVGPSGIVAALQPATQ